MYDKSLVIDLLSQIKNISDKIIQRTSYIQSGEDFYLSDSGMILMDSVCMGLIAIAGC